LTPIVLISAEILLTYRMTYLSGSGQGAYIPTHQASYLPEGIGSIAIYESIGAPGQGGQVYISNLEVKVETVESKSWEAGRASSLEEYVSVPSPEEHYCNRLTSDYVFSPKPFLRPMRPSCQFIGEASDVEEYVREAFRETTGSELPDDITFHVCSPFELKRIHKQFSGSWSPGIMGFAINRVGKGQSEIFVKENFLDELLIIIGHEVGHVMSEPLPSKRDEEAKAFAFEMAWIHALHEKNIAGLRENLVLDTKPASNGLHDVAFSFIQKLLDSGRQAFDIFSGLVSGNISLEQRLEFIPC